MVVVDRLDERLDLAAFRLTGFRHAAGDLGGIAFDSRDESVRERMCLGTSVEGLNYDDLAACSVRPWFHFQKEPRFVLVVVVTFFPAYLPLVMIATRPTLRTV